MHPLDALLSVAYRAHGIAICLERRDYVERLRRKRVPKGADYDRGRCGFENEGRSRKAQGQLRQGTGVEDKWDPALGEFFTHNLCTPGPASRRSTIPAAREG